MKLIQEDDTELGIEDHFKMLGSTITSIQLKDYNIDEETLEYLIEGNEDIVFDLPILTIDKFKRVERNSVERGINPEELPDYIASRLRTIHIETDVFIDSSEFYRFGSLEHLSLSISNTSVDYYEDKDIADLWHVLSDLADGNLKTILFDISDVNETAAEQIKMLMKNPNNVVQLEFIEAKRKKRRRKS